MTLKAHEAMVLVLDKEECEECHCALGEDWEYLDFSNKTVIICPQCEHRYYILEGDAE